MSEYHVVEVCFTDPGLLVESLKEMGYNPEVHEKAVNLHGYQGDKRDQKAHIVIPRQQVGAASNDVGFEKTSGGFVLHASAYDSAWRTGGKIQTLNKTYSEKRLRGYVAQNSKCTIFSRQENKNGQVEILLNVM